VNGRHSARGQLLVKRVAPDDAIGRTLSGLLAHHVPAFMAALLGGRNSPAGDEGMSKFVSLPKPMIPFQSTRLVDPLLENVWSTEMPKGRHGPELDEPQKRSETR
jgi:hypothetical protein